MNHVLVLLTLVVLLFSACCCQVQCAVDPWRFITIADWHGAETFAEYPIEDENNLPRMSGAEKKIETLRHIKNKYGGELVVLPGDSNSGKWYRQEFLGILNVKNATEAVRKAGQRCYQGMKFVFKKAGYNKLLMAVGDHEIGGNPWDKGELKTVLVPNFRDVFYRSFNRDSNGKFLFREPIGSVPSRPLETLYRRTSFAYRHKNVLFVTVDAFRQLSNDFHDKKQGLGGEGSVTCDVAGAHLTWFRKVLAQAQRDPTIKHTIVQTHLPILQPVRKVSCSGQFMDGANKSPFFQAMRDYKVDVYFEGEVHANTATKDHKSNVVQVVSRGVALRNFLTVDVTDDTITITQYNEIGPKPRHNANYEFYGRLTIDKSGGGTSIESSGSLKLLRRNGRPMMHFPFDKMFSLSDRPVLALLHDDYKKTLVQRKITILGIQCWNSFANNGEYGQQYDAQAGNVVLQNGVEGKAAEFNSTSRVAVFGIGPHTGGLKISYALWFKTSSQQEQILVHFGEIFGVPSDYRRKNYVFTLTLNKGIPALHAASNQKLIPSNDNRNLANNRWHHVAISMPRNSCLLSEVRMYVDGLRVATRVDGLDDNLFFTTSGLVIIGGMGHSHPNNKQRLGRPANYAGLIDEVYVWADSLSQEQVTTLTKMSIPAPTLSPTMKPSSPTVKPTSQEGPTFTVHENHKCRIDSIPKRYDLGPRQCKDKCGRRSDCLGYYAVVIDGVYKCRHYNVKPKRGVPQNGSICGIKN